MKLDRIELDRDYRMYVPQSEGWVAHVKHSSDKEYCYFKNPGEEYYHLLTVGEIYLEHNSEKTCLNCALRHGAVTFDRLHWKKGE